MIDTIIIQTAFLSETPGNYIDRNCLSPFFHNTDLPCIPLLLENEIQNEIVKKLIQLIHLFDSKSDFFELKVKSLILDCFYQLLLENKNKFKNHCPSSQEALRRLRIMLDYIHEHFNQPFSLTGLANHTLLSRES